ncbi:unnamed protein product [Brassica napus]|uniref:(rape) hypothetical protein n=1 Tax=Brassica napus TaxID=3708 RepID=A0A816K2V5_BRANA|nr:unnamed protein product [Brassica napus]
MSQIAACKGIEYSSPTLASAISNLTPAFTFTNFRMEQVRLRSSASQAKIIGAILSISGALVIVLYKGPKVLSGASFTSSSSLPISLDQNLTSSDSSWMIGGLFLASQYFLLSVWYILQTRVMETYPEEIRVVFFYNLFAIIISAPVCLFLERNLTSWVLKPDISLAAIVYSGFFVSMFSALTHTWGLHLPLSIAIAVVMGAIFLGDAFHLGRIPENLDIMRETVAWRYFSRDVVPFAAMIAVECTTVGSSTLFKAATLRGFSFYVFVFYSYVVATLVLFTLSLIFGRKRRLPSAKSPLFFKIFLLTLLGLTSRIAGCKGIEYSSPTLSSAISNLTPAFTFMLAVFFRMEQVMLRSSATQAKIIGTIVSISGALVIVLYKGPKLLVAASFTSFEPSWIIGGLLLALQFLLLSVWYILQTQIMEIYPEEISVVLFYNMCATLISALVCLFVERDLNSWKLKPGVSLVAVIYSGFFDTSLGSVIHTWGLHLKGPVYVSLFKPLSIAIAVAMASIFLGDALHLGSVVGSVILSFGFYTVIWGKAREDTTKTISDSEQSLLFPTQNREDETLS